MNIILIGCCLATVHAIFLATLLLRINHRVSNRLLALLLISIAIRVCKSVAGFVFVGQDYLFTVVGVISMAFIGPLIYFFTRSLFESSFRLSATGYCQISVGVLSAPIVLFSGNQFLDLSYYVFTTHLVIYLVATALYLIKNKNSYQSDDVKWTWIKVLLSGVSVITLTFILQLFFYDPLVYRLIVITAACVFYGLSLWAIPQSKLFLPEIRRKSGDEHVYDELGKRISLLLNVDEIFIDPNLTVTKLATLLKSPPYLVSRAINHEFEKSFSELITEYRIRKSEQLLRAQGKLLTIEAIAYESGFNTLSSFYTSFKKVNRITPAQFRDSAENPKMKIA